MPVDTVSAQEDSDHELIARIAAGESAAYRQLVHKYLPLSVRFAEKMLGSRSDAEDVIQEVFCKIWEKAHKWKPEARFSTWLYRVIFNACIDHKRKKKAVLYGEMGMFEDDRPSVEDEMVVRQQSKKLYDAMQTLSEKERAALSLCYYEGISNAQAAEILGVTTGALQVALFRARQKLKEILT
jgi:RNA polymerase sigma-70 factor (ECF subfamily)